MKTTKKKKVLKDYTVNIQFDSYDFHIKAYTAAQAKQKALKKLARRKLESLVDKNNTYVNRY